MIYVTVYKKEGRQELTKNEWFALDCSQLHRLNGPAMERVDGTKYWYVNGKLHRTDGPVIEWSDGTKSWCVNGNLLNTEETETWLEENKVDLATQEGQMAFKLRWA